MTTRPDGIAYIDTVQPASLETVDIQHPSASDSGSSVEEDSDHGEIVWDEPVNEAEGSGSSDGEHGHLDDSVEEDDDVDDADWELSTRDFTKQYNRLRQHHAATNAQPAAGPSRPPIPAQNNRGAQNGQTKQDVSTTGTGKVKVATKHLKDKSDRATQDQVMDSRTKLVLSGLTNRGVIGRLDRCISSGKEANVYFASPTDPSALPSAVKVYRTSILKFRSRSNYIVGEHRFAGEYSSSRNARKMVRVWAEKELRNLKRLEQGGIRAPKVVEGTQNILVMEFLGDDGVAAPRLKDAEVPDDRWQDLYAEMLVIMRRMYITCRLVHADLSEYNILFHHDHLYIIDVSQSVEYDHPKSMEFLRTDIKNITSFFQRRAGSSLRTLGLKRAWEFIITPGEYDEATVEDWLNQPEDESVTGQQDENVFMTSFIPRNLGELQDPEAEVQVRGMPEAVDRLVLTEIGRTEQKEVSSDEDAESEDESEEGVVDGDKTKRGFRHEDKDLKKARKQAVKAENRVKRESKMPKGEKKKLIKKTKGR